MKEVNIAEADINTVATEIMKFASDLPSPEDLLDSRSPAVKVIDCVLSLNRPYDSFVVPRLKIFISNHPDIQQITELAELMTSYSTPHAFVQQELNYNHEDRARILYEVVMFLCEIVQQTPTIFEEKALKQWVVQAQSQTDRLNIRGFGPAGFQYLCILFGVDTTKPDIYIIRFVSDVLDRIVSDLEAHALLEAACERLGLSVRAVDSYIWNRGARPAETIDIATLDGELPPESNETEESANEALPLVSTFDYTYKPVSTSSLVFKIAERCWWRKTSNKNLANMFNINIKKLQSLFCTDMYKQSVFNLMCVQYNSEGFEKWVQRYEKEYQSGMAPVFSQRMKLDKANHEKMLAGVRAFHAAAKEGVKVKVMKQRQDPYKN
ncbi:MAG: hypothetical protein OXH00_04325 [Candidatus Poribacteria bacterium]|nr:hypothetical protein [Candidatus Poribacteria bacterium]